jgi:hypothetical protein
MVLDCSAALKNVGASVRARLLRVAQPRRPLGPRLWDLRVDTNAKTSENGGIVDL